VANARILAIEIEKVPVEAYNSIGKIKRYHGPLERAFEVITANLGISLAPECVLQMAVKAVNNTVKHDGLVLIFLMFGIYPRLLSSSPLLLSDKSSHLRCWRLRSADQLSTGLVLSGAPGPHLQVQATSKLKLKKATHNNKGINKFKINNTSNTLIVLSKIMIISFRIL
jgi:hypothetical protein